MGTGRQGWVLSTLLQKIDSASVVSLIFFRHRNQNAVEYIRAGVQTSLASLCPCTANRWWRSGVQPNGPPPSLVAALPVLGSPPICAPARSGGPTSRALACRRAPAPTTPSSDIALPLAHQLHPPTVPRGLPPCSFSRLVATQYGDHLTGAVAPITVSLPDTPFSLAPPCREIYRA